MTSKTSNASTSEEVASMAPKLLTTPNSSAKAKSVNESAGMLRPPFLHSLKMLKTELRTVINEKWEACWPINMLRPLVLLDLISYLLFIKKIEENQLAGTEKNDGPTDDVISAKEGSELSWSKLKGMDAQSLHELFTKENGLPDLIRSYSHSNLPYSLFLKEPLLLVPTGKLLLNMLAIIKIMEAENSDTKAAIFEFLINKAEIVGHNGQVYAPDYVIKLMVSLMQPASEDMIGDPSAGNGSFFVNCATYIKNNNAGADVNLKNDVVPNIYKGIESDLVQLRIGAMNMILHGIENPKLEVLNIFGKTNINLREQPSLILSNLFFENTEDKVANPVHTEARRPEIRFLNLILKGLKSGGRAAVILREAILCENKTEAKAIRQHIVDDHKLEGVISLHGKTGSLFSNACILIFSKPESGATNKVWFYKLEVKEGLYKKNADAINAVKNDVLDYTEEYNGVQDILSRWKNEAEEDTRKRTDKSFYVYVDEIKANNYILGFSEYKNIVKGPEQYTANKATAPAKDTTTLNTAKAANNNTLPKPVDNTPRKPVSTPPQIAVDNTPPKVAEDTTEKVIHATPKEAVSPPPIVDNTALPKIENAIPPKVAGNAPSKVEDTTQQKVANGAPQTVANPSPEKVVAVAPVKDIDTPPQKQADITPPKVADHIPIKVNDVTTPKVSANISKEAAEATPSKVVDITTRKPVESAQSKAIDITPQKVVDDIPQKEPDPYVQKIQFPAKSTPFIRRRSTVLALIAVICVAAAAFYFMYFRNKNTSSISAATAIKSNPAQPIPAKELAPGMLSSEQIKAILRDTTGILHFPSQPEVSAKGKKLPKGSKTIVAAANTIVPVASASALRVKYAVADTTYFHDQPDASTRRKSYLDPLNKNILTPLDDRNGYIYIEYTNRFRRISKGWINKKDLRALK